MTASYPAVIQSLFALQRHGIKLGLDNIFSLLSCLGHPEKTFRSLHVGGTNGKGSTASMLAAILQAHGWRVGLYTSPHLMDFRERIRVQGCCVSEERVIELVRSLKQATPGSLSPTFFEFTTAMAFQFFAEEQVDLAVVEVGMGGRFDATNVVNSLGAVITDVAMDHEAYLGSSIPAIAGEKAGIIKPHSSVVIGPMAEEGKRIIADTVSERHAIGHWYGTDFHISPSGQGQFDFVGQTYQWKGLSCSLPGFHQMENAACALGLLEMIEPLGIPLSEDIVRSSLSLVRWEGRLEQVAQDPMILLDGAHNPAASTVLAGYLRNEVKKIDNRKLILVFSMFQDKNIQKFLRPLLSVCTAVVLTKMSNERSATVSQLLNFFKKETVPVYPTEHPHQALHVALGLATSRDVVCITGSLFLVGEIKSILVKSVFHPIRG